MRNAYRVWIKDPEGKRPLERLGHRWADIAGLGHEGMDCMHVAHNRDELQVLDDLVTDVWCHKRWEISWPAESLLDYREGCSFTVTLFWEVPRA